MPAAIERLRAGGARRIAVASWFLAPGLLPDRVADLAGPDAVVAEPLGAAPELAALIVDRYTAAATVTTAVRYA